VRRVERPAEVAERVDSVRRAGPIRAFRRDGAWPWDCDVSGGRAYVQVQGPIGQAADREREQDDLGERAVLQGTERAPEAKLGVVAR
jgi:hypothetical protein